MSDRGPEIDPRPAFHRDRSRLLELLDDLDPRDWQQPTACAPWRVRDVVAHLLGDDLARLSRSRDDHHGLDAPGPTESFPTFLARLNERWVQACAALSPVVLREQLRCTTPAVLSFWDGLDLRGLGEPVSWAGPDPAPRRLDCARDFTEYWTHQRQLREALGRERDDDPETDHVAMDTFLRAIPHTLRRVHADPGDTVSIIVLGDAGGRWTWVFDGDGWVGATDHPAEPTARLTMPEDTLWRLCTRLIEPSVAREASTVEGRPDLGDAAGEVLSIIRST